MWSWLKRKHETAGISTDVHLLKGRCLPNFLKRTLTSMADLTPTNGEGNTIVQGNRQGPSPQANDGNTIATVACNLEL